MITASPITIKGARSLLSTLGHDLISYAYSEPIGLWLVRAQDEPLLVTPWAHPVASMFDVYTLSVDTPPTAIIKNEDQLTIEARAQPFRSERVSILKWLEWLVDASQTLDDFDLSGRDLSPGEVPQGTTHTCLTEVALLFTADRNEQLLIGTAESSSNLTVTTCTGEISEYLRACFVESA